ncbi:unnamed protein product [Ophioblennius macclurei]
MKSIVCMSTSVRAACQHASSCFPLNRSLIACTSVGTNVNFTCKPVIAQQPRVTDVRCFQKTRKASSVQSAITAPLSPRVPVPGIRDAELPMYQAFRRVPPKVTAGTLPPLSPYTPYTSPQGDAAALVNLQSLFEEDVIHELCSRLSDLPSSERAEGLATLLGACVEFGLEAHSPPVVRLMNECLELLSHRSIGMPQLCHLGEVACSLEGRQSPMVSGVLDSIGVALEEDMVSPREASAIYSLLTRLHEPASQQQALILSTLHRHTQRLVHRLKASQVSNILQLLQKLQQRQAISLVLRLSHRASRVFKAFRDDEIIKVLSALMILGQHHDELLAAMEKHLPERLSKSDPELISTVMEYCLQMKCRSEPLFEAVADNFVCSAESHTTPQIAKQIVAMGRLNYLPQCSGKMFEKLESILSTRFSQFPPRLLIDVLHSCIHLERFPLNYMSKIFSSYFLQRLQGQGEPINKNTLGQLTQLHLSSSLECSYYWGPRLPFFLHVKRFSSVDQAFETPMETLLYKQVKGPLEQLLGGRLYSTRVFSHRGYTIDVEICLDENGLILPRSQWDQTHKRIALCLDGHSRFCSNTQHLLGKEATKRRHLHKMGFEVVQIPYFEFEQQRTNKDQVQYLHNKIFPTISKFSSC